MAEFEMKRDSDILLVAQVDSEIRCPALRFARHRLDPGETRILLGRVWSPVVLVQQLVPLQDNMRTDAHGDESKVRG